MGEIAFHISPEYQKPALQRVQITASLHQAIVQLHFELYDQAIINLQTGAQHKAEALFCWSDSEKA